MDVSRGGEERADGGPGGPPKETHEGAARQEVTMDIRISREAKRGCGRRKPGALYLVAGAPNAPCGRLPMPLHVCPTCGAGVKPARGWTWIDPQALFKELGACRSRRGCDSCPLGDLARLGDRAGLLWCGAEHYETPDDWLEEACTMGISRRIRVVPRGFEIGKTWVLMAHRLGQPIACAECVASTIEERAACDACDGTGTQYQAAVFTAFRPTGIEYVVRGDESAEELEALAARGIDPVQVVPVDEGREQAPLVFRSELDFEIGSALGESF